MKIVVCVKYVPEAGSERRFTPDHFTDRSVDGRLSELDEYAVEQALRVAEAQPGTVEITYLTVGPDSAKEALRRALSMGGDAAIHVSDEAIRGSDAPATAMILAAAVERAGFDLVLCGMASTDGVMSVVPAMLAEMLGVAQVTFASELTVEGDAVRIRRDADAATEEVAAALPAVVSVTDQTEQPRYPSFKGIMAAKKKPVQSWTLTDLGIDAAAVGAAAAWSIVEEVAARPPRQAGRVVVDEGDAGRQIVDFLAAQKLI